MEHPIWQGFAWSRIWSWFWSLAKGAPSWLPTQAVGVKKFFFFEMGNKEMLIVKYCVIMPYPSYEESVIRKTLWLFDPREIIIKTAMQDEMKRAFVSFHSCHDSTELLMPRRNKEKGPCACQRLKAACFFFLYFFLMDCHCISWSCRVPNKHLQALSSHVKDNIAILNY